MNIRHIINYPVECLQANRESYIGYCNPSGLFKVTVIYAKQVITSQK